MAEKGALPDRLLVAGLNHRSSPVDLRDRVFVDDRAAPRFLARLREDGIDQAVVLSTCDRVEVQGLADAPGPAVETVARALAEFGDATSEEIRAHLYAISGADALRHVFAVAASLESQMIGEPNVLGQVKTGRRLGQQAGTVGTELETVLQAAFAAAKRVRTDTAIGERPVSIAAAAAQIVRDVHGGIERVSGLLLGTGEMGEFLVGELMARGLGALTVIAANEARAGGLARRLGAHYAAIDGLVAALVGADLVVASAGTGRHLVTAEMMDRVLRQRRRRPVLLLDVAVPSDVEAAVNRVDDAYLYGLDDLESTVLEGRASREAAASEAWAIVDAAVGNFLAGRAARASVPTLLALRRRFEAAREEVLAQAKDTDAAEATRLLVNRLLHEPARVLRERASESDGGGAARVEAAARALFRLDDDPGEPREAGESRGEDGAVKERKR